MIKQFQSSLIFTAFMLFSALSTASPAPLHVYTSVDVNVPAEKAWALVGDYNSLAKWHPAVKTSELTGSGQGHGDIRLLTLTDGAAIYDELTEYQAIGKSYTYRLIKSPLPVYGYLGSMRVKDNGNNTSTVIWESRFYADGVQDKEAVALITGVYESGLKALKESLK